MRFKNSNDREHVWEIGVYTVRLSWSQFAIYRGYEAIINLEW